MKKQSDSQNMSGGSLGLLLIYIVVILCVGIFGILPAYQKLAALDQEISELDLRLVEQTTLLPFYAELKADIEGQDQGILKFPAKTRLKHDKIPQIPAIFAAMATKTNLNLLSAIPRAKSLEGGYRYLMVNMTSTGDLAAFRRFLIELGGMASLHHIEFIQVERSVGNKRFKVKLWLAI